MKRQLFLFGWRGVVWCVVWSVVWYYVGDETRDEVMTGCDEV